MGLALVQSLQDRHNFAILMRHACLEFVSNLVEQLPLHSNGAQWIMIAVLLRHVLVAFACRIRGDALAILNAT